MPYLSRGCLSVCPHAWLTVFLALYCLARWPSDTTFSQEKYNTLPMIPKHWHNMAERNYSLKSSTFSYLTWVALSDFKTIPAAPWMCQISERCKHPQNDSWISVSSKQTHKPNKLCIHLFFQLITVYRTNLIPCIMTSTFLSFVLCIFS